MFFGVRERIIITRPNEIMRESLVTPRERERERERETEKERQGARFVTPNIAAMYTPPRSAWTIVGLERIFETPSKVITRPVRLSP